MGSRLISTYQIGNKVFFFFLINQKDFIKKAKAPQKYIGYIQEELLARKRKAGKKIRITKRQRGQVSRSPRIRRTLVNLHN